MVAPAVREPAEMARAAMVGKVGTVATPLWPLLSSGIRPRFWLRFQFLEQVDPEEPVEQAPLGRALVALAVPVVPPPPALRSTSTGRQITVEVQVEPEAQARLELERRALQELRGSSFTDWMAASILSKPPFPGGSA